MSDDGEREKEASAEKAPALTAPIERDGYVRRDEEARGGKGRRRRLLICACAGSVAVLALAFGCVRLATSAQPGDGRDADAPTIAAPAKSDGAGEDEGSPASENGETESKSDKDAEDGETEGASDEASDGGDGNTGPTSDVSPSGSGGSSASNPSGGSASFSGNSSSGGASQSQPQHAHSWVAQTTTVHHDAVYQTVHHEAVTEERHICNGCGADITGSESAHLKENILNGCGGWHSEVVTVQAAYDEQVLVSAAWDETVTTGYACSTCGATK